MTESDAQPIYTAPVAMGAEAPAAQAASIRLEQKHPLAIRWMHWVNFPVLFTMIWSGLLIYWNDSDNAYQYPHRVYRIGIGHFTLIRLFPEWVYKVLHVPYHVTEGLGYHFFFMWIFALNGIAWVLYTWLSGEWRFLLPQRQSIRDAIQVTLVDMHLRRGLPKQTKYNGAQRIAYTSCILMGAMMLVTGLAIYKPTSTHWLTTLCGGYEMARWLHFWTTIAFLGFFGVHVAQVVMAGWNNFRAMVSGQEVVRVEAPDLEAESGTGHERISPAEQSRTGHADLNQVLRTSQMCGSKANRQQKAPTPQPNPRQYSKEEQRPIDPADADDVLTKQLPGTPGDADILQESARRTRRGFVVAGLAAAAGYGLYHSLGDGPSDEDGDNFLRKVLRFNADALQYSAAHAGACPDYPLNRAEDLRVNGVYGLKRELDLPQWRLQLVGMRRAEGHPRYAKDVTAWDYRYLGETDGDQGHDTKVDPAKEAGKSAGPTAHDDTKGSKQDGTSIQSTAAKMAPEKMQAKATVDGNKDSDDSNEPDANGTGRTSRGNEEAGESNSTLKPNTPGLLLQMSDITKLPRHELVTQFKCIEGWSQIVHWAGVRMADFLDAYPPAPIDGKDPKYVYMETPDGDYYTGYDLHVMRHPQTLLVTEMMGEPLTQFHGAPLRLHMPTKYGYKQIKRIGLIAYINDRPDDYWTKLGYDWYAGL